MTKRAGREEPVEAADPFAIWRELYESNARLWSSSAKESMSSAEFAKSQGKMLETVLAFQKTARDSMNAQLGAMNLPSRDDLARLGELILGLEEKIDGLDDRLAALESASRPAREKPAAKRAKAHAITPDAAPRARRKPGKRT